MATIVFRPNAPAARHVGPAGLRATVAELARRATACAAAAVMICAVGAALLQLAAQVLSFPAPVAVTAIALLAVTLLYSLRRHLRAQALRRYGLRNPHAR
jgi:membrane protein implicated in regulation of membrane protease activity